MEIILVEEQGSWKKIFESILIDRNILKRVGF